MAFPHKGLHLIVSTDKVVYCRVLQLAEEALAGGIDSIQFRHKGTYTNEMLSLAGALLKLCRAFHVPLIVNDRFDVALAIGADGVHLGQSDVPIAIGRHWLGSDKVIGATASTLEEALKAQNDGADYIGFGHIFPTLTKAKAYPPVGLEALKAVCTCVHIPVWAIGGIDDTLLAGVLDAGASGIAMAAYICGSLFPRQQVERIKQLMEA